MTTLTVEKQRKNIDLPIDTIRKLSILAAAYGESLKAFMENLLIAKASGVQVEISESPSPSGDEWYDDPENLLLLQEAEEEYRRGVRGKEYTIEELREMAGIK
ncbi:MAG: hypothetical protein LUC85_01535 [Bacteroidales bacterium]|nr:hypothetical protein [Bacteroidales bacterium]MCD8393501.1 hypothetical protein [Bacteroidales bacterium]